jgi:hypothetical protein
MRNTPALSSGNNEYHLIRGSGSSLSVFAYPFEPGKVPDTYFSAVDSDNIFGGKI